MRYVDGNHVNRYSGFEDNSCCFGINEDVEFGRRSDVSHTDRAAEDGNLLHLCFVFGEQAQPQRDVRQTRRDNDGQLFAIAEFGDHIVEVLVVGKRRSSFKLDWY